MSIVLVVWVLKSLAEPSAKAAAEEVIQATQVVQAQAAVVVVPLWFYLTIQW
jgi:hypothetical protein